MQYILISLFCNTFFRFFYSISFIYSIYITSYLSFPYFPFPLFIFPLFPICMLVMHTPPPELPTVVAQWQLPFVSAIVWVILLFVPSGRYLCWLLVLVTSSWLLWCGVQSINYIVVLVAGACGWLLVAGACGWLLLVVAGCLCRWLVLVVVSLGCFVCCLFCSLCGLFVFVFSGGFFWSAFLFLFCGHFFASFFLWSFCGSFVLWVLVWW